MEYISVRWNGVKLVMSFPIQGERGKRRWAWCGTHRNVAPPLKQDSKNGAALSPHTGVVVCECDLKCCFYRYLFFQPWYFNEIFIFKAYRKQIKADDASSNFC